MATLVIRSLRKQLEQVRHQPIPQLAQEQNEQQVQPSRIELVNIWNVDASQRAKVSEQHQNEATQVVQRDLTMLSTIHQTP